jgi:hypothetical protein
MTVWVSYEKQELLILRKHRYSPPDLGVVRVAHLLSLLCFVVFLFSFMYRPVSCVPDVECVPVLLIALSVFCNVTFQNRNQLY